MEVYCDMDIEGGGCCIGILESPSNYLKEVNLGSVVSGSLSQYWIFFEYRCC